MPIYLIQCETCEETQDVFRAIDDRDKDLPECCGKKMVRKIAGLQTMVDIQPYVSMIDGTVINSRSQHKSHLKQHGCVEVGNDSSLSRAPRPMAPPPGLKETLIKAVFDKRRK